MRPEKLLAIVVAEIKPQSVLDVGCGTGGALDYFAERGIDVLGFEGSSLARDHARRPQQIRIENLQAAVHAGRQFDLVWSYEVVEHIHPDFVENLMETLTSHAPRVVVSGARPGQGGEGHFNEQEPAYWIEKFARRNFVVDQALTAKLHASGDLYCENMLAFRKAA